MSNVHSAKPPTASPPPGLKRLKAEALKLPAVAQAGFTVTEDGMWALKLWLREGEYSPIPEIEEISHGYPIIYDHEPAFPPVARPAYPEKGE